MLKWQIPSLGKILKVEIWDNHFNICNSYISREKKKKKWKYVNKSADCAIFTGEGQNSTLKGLDYLEDWRQQG